MDDIDRLDKNEIQAIFRLVKLTSDFPKTTFVLAFDPNRVADALQEQYGGIDSSRSFVEKIVQVPLSLPPLTYEKLIDATLDQINALLDDAKIALDPEHAGDWGYFFRTHFGKWLKSPRLIKRYANNLQFYLAGMKDEVFVPDLLSIEAVHTFFPALYDLIRARKDLFLLRPTRLSYFEDTKYEALKAELKIEISRFPESEKSIIQKILVKLFPRTETVFGNSSYGDDWFAVWEKQKRITAPNYFHRYFQFGVPDDDISDTELVDFLNSLDRDDVSRHSEKMSALISNDRENLFLDKLSNFNSPSDMPQIQRLAMCIAISQSFPVWHGDFLAESMSPAGQAVRFLRSLLERITDENIRKEVAVGLASRAQPLDFAVEFARYSKYVGAEYGVSLKDQEPSELARAVMYKVAERISEFASSKSLDTEFPKQSERMYSLWRYKNADEVFEYVRSKLEGKPELIDEFVRLRNRQSWDVTAIARIWGFKYIIEGLETANPDLLVPELENVTANSRYLSDSEDHYLGLFVAIAKELHADYIEQEDPE